MKKTVKLDNDVWNVLSVGISDERGTYAHLSSTTRFFAQKNGKYPVQSCRFIPTELVA